MRFRTWRAWSLALSLAALGLGLATSTRARADWPIHTIPRLAPAYNFTTGGEFMAPPVPYGHYAKDYVGEAQKCIAGMQAHLAGLCGHFKGHHGTGDGCDGPGCGGAFGHKGGSGCGDPGCFGGISCGIMGHRKHGGSADYDSGAAGAGYATTISGPSAQTIAAPSAQALCGQAGCKVGGKHSHLGGFGGHSGGGLCGDPGCGLGFAHSHGNGNGNGYGDGNGGCSFCGGKGCKHCMGKGGGLGSMIHGKLASLAGGLHHPKLTWFVGAGGPVPLTPGYVPYIVTTRSPREFFAFAPMNPNAP